MNGLNEILTEGLKQIIELCSEITKIFSNIINIIFAAILSLIFKITGGENDLLKFLYYAMLIDYASGICKSFITGNMNSKTGVKGILKKFMMILVIAAINIVDNLINGPAGLKNIFICLFLSNEILSVIENASLSGLPIPKWLKTQLEKRLEQYRDNKRK